jgi:hypothetical protein
VATVTPEGIKILYHDIGLAISEASQTLRKCADVHGSEYAKAKYRVDSWEYINLVEESRDGVLEAVRRILEHENRGRR